jgi:hypothetical protein
MSKEIDSLKEWLDSQEFYELMQQYRHAPIVPTDRVVKAFHDVKLAVCSQAEKILNNS